MKLLSRFEEILLLSILKLGDKAYSLTIREHLKQTTDKTWAFGALFVTLERLVKKKYLVSYVGEETPERGGRRKRLYRVTNDGIHALIEIKKVDAMVWENREIKDLEMLLKK